MTRPSIFQWGKSELTVPVLSRSWAAVSEATNTSHMENILSLRSVRIFVSPLRFIILSADTFMEKPIMKNNTENSSIYNEVLILDFDGSVSLPGLADSVNLRSYEERIRYCAGFRDMSKLETGLKDFIDNHEIFFTGNGDFHHVSYMLIKNTRQTDLTVVVFDNHPDNMFFPFGIHCGSWVYHASRLPNVARIAVFGIASNDIAGFNIIQNRFSVIRAGKVRYFCLRPVGKLLRSMGGLNIEEITAPGIKITEVFDNYIKQVCGPVYLSIDKDVLQPEVVGTTWDQGQMPKEDLFQCISSIASRIVCADICGDLSTYRYRHAIKRLIRRFDGADRISGLPDIEKERHIKLNLELLSCITGHRP